MSTKNLKMADAVRQAVAKRLARELWEPGARIRKGVLKSLAAEHGVSLRTIQNWTKLPEFIAAVRKHIAKYDDAFDDGLMLALRGDGEKLGPNAAVLIWYGKTRFNRDEKLKHQAQKHKHALKEIEHRAEHGVTVDDVAGAVYQIMVGEYGVDEGFDLPAVPEPEDRH